MAGLANIRTANKEAVKTKKHGKKKIVRPSEKKNVKKNRHQVKQPSKVKIAKTVAAIPDGLDGCISDDELKDLDWENFQPEFDEGEFPFEDLEDEDKS